jgi:AcrR family transcriptional regulator
MTATTSDSFFAPASRARLAPARPARRLPYEERRAQLVELAAPIVAEHGLAEFSLDAVAAGANVTRNLLYHYFPRGRRDIVIAAAEYAGQQLTEGWIVDENIPLLERVAGNFRRFVSHAVEPSVAWRLNRLARSAGDPEIDAIIDRFHEAVVSSVALNQLGTTDPPQMVRIAIKAFVVFGESVLDQAREEGVPPERSLQLVAQALTSSIQAGVAASQ